MNKIIKKICVVFVLALIIIGILTVGAIVHEMVHYYDLKDTNTTILDVCFVKLPLDEGNNESWWERAGGEVRFMYFEEDALNFSTWAPEWKAYLIESIVIVILLIITFCGLWRINENEDT